MCRTPWSNFGSTGVGRCVICAERVWGSSRGVRGRSVGTGCDRRRVAVGWVFPGNFDWSAQHETPTDTHTHGGGGRAECGVSAD